jgi:hypothetical protein
MDHIVENAGVRVNLKIYIQEIAAAAIVDSGEPGRKMA